jgi:hypothetical protein
MRHALILIVTIIFSLFVGSALAVKTSPSPFVSCSNGQIPVYRISGGQGYWKCEDMVSATPGGLSGQIQYNNASAFDGISGTTTDGTNTTFGSNNLLATSPLFTTNQTTTKNNIGSTSTDGIILQNLTAAANGAQQWSPRIHLIGRGWKTNSTAASETVDWIAEIQSIQDGADPRSKLVFSSQINSGGYTGQFFIGSDSKLEINGGGWTVDPFAPSMSMGGGWLVRWGGDAGFRRVVANKMGSYDGSSIGDFELRQLYVDQTITPALTTGNQTIDKAAGTVNIAATGSSVTVTNNLVSASSTVYATARTNDATCMVKNAVPGSGTFTINMTAACTAETSIGFFVINK